ncbi:MAG: nucleotidyltransferase domain-containing protein [Ktedonobacteraceae bacterium]
MAIRRNVKEIMEDILLQNSSGNAQADAVMREVIRVYEDAYPQHIAGYYVEGSYTDRTHLATSDLDLVMIFHQPFADDEARKAAEQAWNVSNKASTLEVDITLVNEQELQAGVDPNLKLGSRFIYGEDVCRNYPILPIEAWTRDRMHASYWLLVNIYQRPTPVQLELDFPDITDEFYGYVNRTIQLPDGREVPCTRNLVRTTGWAATALLALQAGQYAARKRDCTQLYRTHIGGTWATLLEDISTFCRYKWQYLIPNELAARQQLRAICERTLLFERYFLTLYKDYLLGQLQSTQQEQLNRALWVQEHSPLADTEVTMVLQTIRQ